jgi:hypothetical protein
MSPLDWVWFGSGLILQSMVASAMLRGSYRRYPFIFVYVVFSFLMTFVQVAFRYYFGVSSRGYVRAYWIGDFIGTSLVLLIIVHLLRAALAGHPLQRQVYVGLIIGLVATAGGSVLLMRFLGRGFNLGRWMTEVGRDYYFSAVLLNAILWCMLIRRKHANVQLFLLTSGLGLKLCGAAIAHALRLSGVALSFSSQFIVITYLASLWVWYVALKRPEPQAGETAGELTVTPR